MFKSWAALTFMFFLAGPDAVEILRRADAPYDAFTEGVISLRVLVSERGKETVASRLEIFVKGTDLSLLVFRQGKQQGRKILTQKDRVFLIVPTASKPIPVSKSHRLIGAAAFGDIARMRFAEDYDATVRPADARIEGASDGTLCRVLDLAAKKPGSAYPSAVLWVGRDDGLARRVRLSLASGKAAKEVSFTSYDGDHRIATMEIRDLLSAGGANVTALVFERYEKRPLDAALFDPEGARAVP